ncbi:MAG TPA: GNAT family N-acetyltransferase [Candidatus Dormibacteraeota bacterium]|nr:GNAT family N-acetyltransferase [Candidatus Dormibacteraeota bacterium]
MRRITEFRPEDAAAVAQMTNDSNDGWPGGFVNVPRTAADIRRREEENHTVATFLSWEDGAVAGYCSLYEYPEEAGTAGYVGLLNSSSRFRGRGHGRDLLRAALDRSVELGYERIDLHTWEGNMLAVPLYKKSGYWWVPDSQVHMENYLPLLLRTPALADFWKEADWYRSMVRDLSVEEDLNEQGGMWVYPCEFRHGSRLVRATIDATSRGLTALETERWRVSCEVSDRHLFLGQARQVRWRVENLTGEPVAMTLVASAGEGLRLREERTETVADRFECGTDLTADADYRPPGPGRPQPVVETLVVLDGIPIHLRTGVLVEQPVEIALSGGRTAIAPGRPARIRLELRNHLEVPATAHLVPAPSGGLRMAVDPIDVDLEADSYAGAEFEVEAPEPGAHVLELAGWIAAGDERLALVPLRLPLPAPAPGRVVAIEDERWVEDEGHPRLAREVRLETARLRLVIQLHGGGYQLREADGDRVLGGGGITVGPPFTWMAQARVRHEARVEAQEGGGVAVRLTGPVPEHPQISAEHELALTPEGLLSMRSWLQVLDGAPRRVGVSTVIWAADEAPSPQGRTSLVLPLVEGLIRTGEIDFPDWESEEEWRPDRYAEGWAAREVGDLVVGAIWSDARSLRPWGLMRIEQGADDLRPGEVHALAPSYVYAGGGGWETVRAWWRRLVQPDAPVAPPESRPLTRLRSDPLPSLLIPGREGDLVLETARAAGQSGTLRWEPPPGWRVTPAESAVEGVRSGRPGTVRVVVSRDPSAARAAEVRARLRTSDTDLEVFSGAAIDLGAGGEVRIEDEGERLTVDNGALRLAVVPGFRGTVVSLTTADGTEHVLSAHPEPREFGWMRPWYGGIGPNVYGPGIGSLPDARPIGVRFEAREDEEAGAGGRRWRGLRVEADLDAHNLRGLTLWASYLTLPGCPLLALRLGLRNRTTAWLRASAALPAFLQPGGTVEGVELATDAAPTRLLRRQRTISVPGGDWVSLAGRDRGWRADLIRGAEATVVGLDWGELGAHAAATLEPRLEPGGERSALAFLVLTRDEAEARAYHALTGARRLP